MTEINDTLKAILSELKELKTEQKKSGERFDRIETRLDKSDATIAGLKGAISTNFVSLSEKIDSVAAGLDKKMDVRFDRLESKLDGITEHLGKTHVEVSELKHRVSKLEGPSA